MTHPSCESVREARRGTSGSLRKCLRLARVLVGDTGFEPVTPSVSGSPRTLAGWSPGVRCALSRVVLSTVVRMRCRTVCRTAVVGPTRSLIRLFAVEGVVRSTRRWPGRGRGLPRMEVTMISGSKCSGSGWSPIGRFSGAGLSSPTDGVVAADARARPGTRWSGGWRTSRSGGGPRCWRSASADTGVTPPPTTRNTDRRRVASRQSPTLPSIISRRMSAWPACRAVSTITCRYTHVSSLPRGVVTA